MRYVSYAVRHNRPVEAQVLLRAEELSERMTPSDVELQLDSQHPIATGLEEVLLSKRPILYQWMPRFSSILHAPNWLA